MVHGKGEIRWQTYLKRPPIVHIKRLLRILIPIFGIEIDAGIIDQYIDGSLLLYFACECLDALQAGDV